MVEKHAHRKFFLVPIKKRSPSEAEAYMQGFESGLRTARGSDRKKP
jgi:hypothetical protein